MNHIIKATAMTLATDYANLFKEAYYCDSDTFDDLVHHTAKDYEALLLRMVIDMTSDPALRLAAMPYVDEAVNNVLQPTLLPTSLNRPTEASLRLQMYELLTKVFKMLTVAVLLFAPVFLSAQGTVTYTHGRLEGRQVGSCAIQYDYHTVVLTVEDRMLRPMTVMSGKMSPDETFMRTECGKIITITKDAASVTDSTGRCVAVFFRRGNKA